ncbi:MAG: hypothetical protein JGK40_30865 [Microcoleus sp. PH2017_21_RUC_O_A]|uniref:hypothetical protein n=1 Tax=Microcoleus sp. PH2017_21_RUC_O_A TaxID=2798832 RepID=UPI001DEED992|nr:hypothetical protein [Microcoleus sp. PH2017_21_RUC_O_A]MCC3532355.1 hypothetical protein [Microcoleus sp. PH2017_21_RUC_O_A]
MEISSGEISGKFSAVSLAISGLWIRVGEIFKISPVRRSVDSAGIAGISGWRKTGVSILSPVISSIELKTAIVEIVFSEIVGFLVSATGDFSVFGSAGFGSELGISETVGFLVSVAREFSGFGSGLGISETVGFLVSVAGEFSGFGSGLGISETVGFLASTASLGNFRVLDRDWEFRKQSVFWFLSLGNFRVLDRQDLDQN